ncbi:MAG: DUF2147 domain-containing protein [Litorimonas sp.]
MKHHAFKYLALSFVLTLAAGNTSVSAGEPATILGSWRTDTGSAIIDISFCEPTRPCGKITWVDPNGASVVDRNNPDDSLKDRPLIGVMMLWGFKAKGNKWKGGKIYNPQDGKTYSSKVSLNDDRTLKVKGCVGPICKTQIWTRVEP